MKKLLQAALFLGLSIYFSQLHAQVGIGTETPSSSAQLEIVSNHRGILIPQVALESEIDQSTISAGNVESLLVWNTSTNEDMFPGYYYWYNDKWQRLVSNGADDGILTSDGDDIYYVNKDGDKVQIDINNIVTGNETLTNIRDNGDGTFSYTNERGDIITFDANTTSYTDNGDGTFTFTNANGDTMDIDTNADAIAYDNTDSGLAADNVKDAIDELTGILENGAGVELVDNNDGTITLKSDDGTVLGTIDKASLADNSDGTYTFNNGDGNPIIIDVPASVINQFDEIINNGPVVVNGDTYTTVEEYFQDLIETNETLTVLTDNGDGTFTYTDENGSPVTFDANTTSYTDNGDGTFTFTNANGDTMDIDTNADAIAYDNADSGLAADNVKDAIDELTGILENGAGVELVDNNDGTITLKSDDGTVLGTIDKAALTDNNDGTYTFNNGDGNPIIIDVPASVINQFDEIINDGPVVVNGDTFNTVEEYFQDLIETNETLTVLTDNGDGTFTYTDENGSPVTFDANTTSYTDNGDGTFTFTNANGDTMDIDTNANALAFDNSSNGFTSNNVQDALEELKTQLDDTTDELVDNADGTYTHTAIDGTVVTIDANTTSVSVVDGVYTFTDGAGNTITTIDTNADAIAYDNTDSGLAADNVKDAIDELTGILENGAGVELVDNNDGTITLKSDDGTVLGTIDKAALADNSDGTYTFDNGDGNPIIIDVPASVINQFDEIINNGPVVVNGDTYTTVEEYFQDLIETNETLTALGYDALENELTYKDEKGVSNIIQLNNTNLDYDNVTQELNYVDSKGQSTTIDLKALVTANESVTTLSIAAGSLEYANEDNTNADVPLISTDPENGIEAGTDGALFAKNIYNTDGTLTESRTVSGTEHWLNFKGTDGSIYINGNNLRSENNADGITNLYFDGSDARLMSQGKIDKLEIGTNSTTNPAPISFVTSSGAMDPGAERMRITGTGAIGIDTSDPTEQLDVGKGNVRIRDINDEVGTVTDKVVVADMDGVLKTIDVSHLAVTTATADNGLTEEDHNIQLGGALIKPTTITTDDTNTLAIEGLQEGKDTDEIIVVDPASGVLSKVKAVMPKFFYMPSIIVPTSQEQMDAPNSGKVSGDGFNDTTRQGTIQLYERYNVQFGSPMKSNANATTTLPVLPASGLDYYITWYDTEVFESVNVSDTGVMVYTVKQDADINSGSFMNIVFAVK